MGGNARANKARNQTTGSRRGPDNAQWLKNNTGRNRRRRQMAKLSRKKNR